MEQLQTILSDTNDFLWSYIVIFLLAAAAIFFTCRLHFVQFRLVHEMLRLLIHPDKVQPEDIGPDELSEQMPDVGKTKYISLPSRHSSSPSQAASARATSQA